jgi:hypothetical protein
VGTLSIDRAPRATPRHCHISKRSALAAVSVLALAGTLAIPVAPAAAQGWSPVWNEAPVEVQSKPKPKVRLARPQPEPALKDPFGNIPKGPLQIIISIDKQTLYLYSNGALVADTLIATGVPEHPTPAGVFSVIEKDLLHHSNIYSGAPMPYMQRITWSGVALHEGVNLGHPASHGCIRMPHDFATRLWVVTRLGVRVIIARPELRPQEFADPHLFVHREKPATPIASAAPMEKLVKTAQTADPDKKSDVPYTAKDAADSAPARVVVDPADPAAEPDPIELRASAAADAKDSTEPVSPPDADRTATSGTEDAPAALQPPVPMPLPKPSAIAQAAANGPISIFVSRKDQKIYVRQEFSRLFDAPIVIERPDQPIGTHVFTALAFLDDQSTLRWNAVSLPAEQPKTVRSPERDPKFARWKRPDERAQPALNLPPPQTAQQALARIDIPQDVIDRISRLIVPGSSLVVSDQGLGDETGDGTDFIVVTR